MKIGKNKDGTTTVAIEDIWETLRRSCQAAYREGFLVGRNHPEVKEGRLDEIFEKLWDAS